MCEAIGLEASSAETSSGDRPENENVLLVALVYKSLSPPTNGWSFRPSGRDRPSVIRRPRAKAARVGLWEKKKKENTFLPCVHGEEGRLGLDDIVDAIGWREGGSLVRLEKKMRSSSLLHPADNSARKGGGSNNK